MSKYVTRDTGVKEDQGTGAVRNVRAGKGRYDLIPPTMLKRLAAVYENGATIYGDHNWTKGFKFSRCIDSALRHINQFREGLVDEDHLAQAIFNLSCMIHFEEQGRDDLDDREPYVSLKEEDA